MVPRWIGRLLGYSRAVKIRRSRQLKAFNAKAHCLASGLQARVPRFRNCVRVTDAGQVRKPGVLPRFPVFRSRKIVPSLFTRNESQPGGRRDRALLAVRRLCAYHDCSRGTGWQSDRHSCCSDPHIPRGGGQAFTTARNRSRAAGIAPGLGVARMNWPLCREAIDADIRRKAADANLPRAATHLSHGIPATSKPFFLRR
jgi:hypothetical protein